MKDTKENRARRRARQRRLRNRRIALTICLMLGAAVVSVGGTVAWLTARTESVVNTFTYGNIDIDLLETTSTEYTIIPGMNLCKNPKVTVKAGSEDCWLFVKADEESWPPFTNADGTRKVSYAIENGWTALDGHSGVYWRSVNAVSADTDFFVLDNDQVTVSENLTKEDLATLTRDNLQPKLTFTAYAVQREGFDSALAAWAVANPTTNP